MKWLLRFAVLIIFILVFFRNVFDSTQQEWGEPGVCVDQYETINGDGDRWHQRSWEFNQQGSLCTSYLSYRDESVRIGAKRNYMRIKSRRYEERWGEIYKKIVKDSKPNLEFFLDSLNKVAAARQLSGLALAEMVVSFVQDIPYKYVLAQGCSTFPTRGTPCLGRIAHGILSPYEFLHTLYGDCDTRAVLIYSVLEEMGFDPMIVVSEQYAHAMLALNLPSAGDYIRFRGRKYYFWETTAKGWPLGMLPPNSNNMSYWKIALVNGL